MKKIDILKAAMENNNWRLALSIASKFPRLGEFKSIIITAHEAFEHPDFYIQLKKDPEVLISAGIEALKKRYNNSSIS